MHLAATARPQLACDASSPARARSRCTRARSSRCRWPTSCGVLALGARRADRFASSGTSTTTARQARATSPSSAAGRARARARARARRARTRRRRRERAAPSYSSTDSISGRSRAICDRGRRDLDARQAPAEAAAVKLAQQRAVAAAHLQRARGRDAGARAQRDHVLGLGDRAQCAPARVRWPPRPRVQRMRPRRSERPAGGVRHGERLLLAR